MSEASERMKRCQISQKDHKVITPTLTEWFSSSTLNNVLKKWEDHNKTEEKVDSKQTIPMTFALYNVQGFNSRGLEVVELIHKVDASFIICTEVGELWHTQQLPDFNIFHEGSTNKNGGVMIGVGKHLKASKVETNLANTLVIDIFGLNEPLRVIGIYWPNSQKRDIKKILQFVTNNTIVAGDFNAAVAEWNSPKTDKRESAVKKWSEDNNLQYIKCTGNSSKRSLRNIDLTFTNCAGITGETLEFGTSDHWPLVYKSKFILFESSNKFPVVKWKIYELLLCLLQEYWLKQSEYKDSIEWYREYIRFLAALKNRLTTWLDKKKWKPTLPQEILDKIRAIKTIRNRFLHNHYEEDRLLLRQKTREIRKEINIYRSNRWNNFLSSIQVSQEKSNNTFWKFLSRIYRPSALPFNKLSVKNKQLISQKEITRELFEYYKKLFSPPLVDLSNTHDAQVASEYNEIIMKISQCDEKIKPTNIREIKRLIQGLKPKKSAGEDNISNWIIKKLSPAYLECLCKCFNDWLNKHEYIADWKTAKIITLNKLKAGTPSCEQTRPISLLATHSKIYEKILLDRVRDWTESNNIIPPEQSGFRKGYMLQTRVLSIYQEIKNSLAGNVPTLGIYVDYKKAYDLVWHMGLIVKLFRLNVPTELLKVLLNWLSNRKAYITFGSAKSDDFNTHVGLPQGSSLSPYIFIMYHADIVKNTRAFSTHLFADDLSTLIVPPIHKDYQEMIKFINSAGTQICQNLYEYSIRWKQPINISKTVVQIFHTQGKQPEVEIKMNNIKLETVRIFKYLGFTWSDKMSLKPTVDKCLDNIQRSYSKLKWLQRNKNISTQVLRTCFFAYSFPFFTWIFPFFPLLSPTLRELFQRKFRVGLRLVHRCPFITAEDMFKYTKEKPLEQYVCKYLQKRLANAHRTDLGRSMFYEDIFCWENFVNWEAKDRGRRRSLGVGHFFRLNHVKKMKERHKLFLLTWLSFLDQYSIRSNTNVIRAH
jgi:hypothetical protein